jgi:hypothetical protein
MVHSMTRKHEIAEHMAALFILRGSCAYISHNYKSLPLAQIMAQLHKNDSNVQLIDSDDHKHFILVSVLDDYKFRPEKYEMLSIYEYTMHYFRKKIDQSQMMQIDDNYLFGHPLYETHRVARYKKPKIPVSTGKRLPEYKRNGSIESRNEYAKLCLSLFKPFRTVDDLCTSTETHGWDNALVEWLPKRNCLIIEVMHHMGD